ncbi:MAG TPA: hypothetical protein PKL77_06185 [Candidatus Omnitrophota bacterium]|nr:hypothetical protein [Candidatus Omnitrophota bacterium]
MKNFIYSMLDHVPRALIWLYVVIASLYVITCILRVIHMFIGG